VAFTLYLRFGDLSLLVNDERRADHALNGLAYIFFSPYAP